MRCPTLVDLLPPSPGRRGWPWSVDTPAPDPCPSSISNWPRISIVTPSFNQGKFLEETIRSVLLQGYPNLEYIIIDGGSTDGSVEIIKKYESWLKYWISEPDGGQAEAINKGFAACTGELLAFINSDDFYAKGALHEVAATWKRAGCPKDALISGRVQDISATGLPLPHLYQPPPRMVAVRDWLIWGYYKWIIWGIGLHQPGCFWTAATWRRCGPLPTDLHHTFDRYFFAKIAAKGGSVFIVADALLSFFRLHAGSKTMSQWAQFPQEWRVAVERLRPDLSFRHRISLRHVQWRERNWEFVSKVMAESDPRIARRLLVRHLTGDPASIIFRPILGAAGKLALSRNAIGRDGFCNMLGRVRRRAWRRLGQKCVPIEPE